MAPIMKSFERRHNQINKAINLVRQHRLPEALSKLNAFDKEFCSAPKKGHRNSDTGDNGNKKGEI